MIALLLLLTAAYLVLAVLVYDRRPQALSNRFMSAYLVGVAGATAGLAIVSVAAHRAEAEGGARLAMACLGAANAVLMPVAVLGIHFSGLANAIYRPLRAMAAPLLSLPVVLAMLWISVVQGGPLVEPAAAGYRLARAVDGNATMAAMVWLSIAGGVVTGVLVVFGIVKRRIIPRWVGSLYLAAMILGILIGGLLHLGAREPIALTLYHTPLIIVLLFEVIRFKRTLPLRETLRALYGGQSDGALALDATGAVFWASEGVSRFLGAPTTGTVAESHVAELIRGTPLWPTVRDWLGSGAAEGSAEVAVPLGDGERVVRVRLMALDHLPDYPGARLLVFDDVTTARIHRALTDLRREFAAMAAVGEAISSSLDPQQVMESALRQVLQVTDADTASIYLVDPSHPDRLRVAANQSRPEASGEPALWLDVNQSIPGAAVQRNAPVSVDDFDTTPDRSPQRHVAGMRSVLAVPLSTQEAMLGALAVASRAPGLFTPQDRFLLESIGRQIGVALEHARLHERERRLRQLSETLREVGRIVGSTLDLDSALQAILAQLGRVVQYDSASIMLRNEEGRLRFSATVGFDPAVDWEDAARQLEGDAVSAQIFASRQPLLIDDTRGFPGWVTVEAGAQNRAFIGAPLIARDQVIGVLNVDSRTPGAYDQEAVEIVQAFADQVAVAIENARLFSAETARRRDLQVLNTIAADSAESLDLERRLNIVLDHVLEATGAEAGAIHLVDPNGARLVLQAQRGLSPEMVHAALIVPVGAGLCDLVMQGGQPATFTMPGKPPVAFIAAPLTAGGKVMGALSLSAVEALTPGSDRVALLVSIGRQVGAAVVNAQLYRRALDRERLSEALSRLGLAISATLDEQEVLNLICQESTAVFGVESALVSLVEEDELAVVAAYGRGMHAYMGSRERIRIGRSLGAQVVAARRPLYENRVREQFMGAAPDWLEETRTESKLGVPMLRDGEPIGAIVLVSTSDPDHFSPFDIEPANLLGVQAGLALQNARLYAEVKRRLEYSRLVDEVGRYATAVLSVDAMVQGVCRRIYTAFGYDVIALFLANLTADLDEKLDAGKLAARAVFVNGQAVDPDQLDVETLPVRVVTRAAKRGEAALVSVGLRLTTDPQLAQSGRTDLATPLMMAEDVIGVLAVSRLRPNAINSDEADVLKTLAMQIAVAFSNARLFDTVRRQRDELEDRVRERTAQIEAQKEQTEAILRSVPDAVIVTDLAGKIVLANPPAAHLLQRPETEHNVRQWVRALVAGADARKEMELGAKVYQATASRVVQDDRELGAVIALRDITRLHELDRLKSQFVSTVSHELRTPLTNIKLYASLLQQGKPERQEKYVEVIERESLRLEKLVIDLLDLSRLERQETPPQREALDIAHVIEAVIDNHAGQAELKRLTLAYEPNGNLPCIFADRNQLIQVFTNLVNNAILYTPAGGQVTVRTCPGTYRDAPAVRVEVQDTGVGIAPEEVAHIFDRFYRGSNVAPDAAPGTGLGLAIVKEIINLHCGTIEVSSEVGRGSTFAVVLPVAPPEHS